MADYGLKVKNNSGEIQIDSTYRNLSLDESGTGITISNDNTGSGYYTRITIASSSLVPLVLIRPNTDYFVGVRNYYKSGSDFAGVDIVTQYSKSTTIDWQSYRENRTASGENYGLLVYNSSGELCFDSGKRYFKISSVHEINLSTPVDEDTGPYTDITHSEISDPYYILSPSSYWFYAQWETDEPETFSSTWYHMIGIKKLSSTSVRVGWFCFGQEDVPGDVNFDEGLNNTMKLIVCDTT